MSTAPHASSGSTFTRWDFLTMPYDDLLYTLGVTVVTRPAPDDWPVGREFMAGVMVTPSGQLSHVIAAPYIVGLEREYTIRGLLAKWHGADATNWPVAMAWSTKGVPHA
ncbi:hypothetical protein R6V09_01195 [Streptomyces sp. W16]|uniref:hypothetical protein n=1 Tax=Streptomyces sp. W16 TaxID=3076631 RepID=UPI00295B1316|nr:hypothetical protein [Streptomyces sp. W16]MDV9168759.1 hypothetical protein [Streptomyces sp. W16]